MGSKPIGVTEFQFAAYTDVSTDAVGSYVSFPRNQTITFTADAETFENVYDGGRDRAFGDPSGTLAGSWAGVPLAAIAACLGLTLGIAGTGATLVTTLIIPKRIVPPLGIARWRQITADGGDQTATAYGVRFAPAPSTPAAANAFTNTSFSAVVDGNDVTNRFITYAQRATASQFS